MSEDAVARKPVRATQKTPLLERVTPRERDMLAGRVYFAMLSPQTWSVAAMTLVAINCAMWFAVPRYAYESVWMWALGFSLHLVTRGFNSETGMVQHLCTISYTCAAILGLCNATIDGLHLTAEARREELQGALMLYIMSTCFTSLFSLCSVAALYVHTNRVRIQAALQ